MKESEEESARLKMMFDDLSLVHHALENMVEKSSREPNKKKALVEFVVEEHGVSFPQTFIATRVVRRVIVLPTVNRDFAKGCSCS